MLLLLLANGVETCPAVTLYFTSVSTSDCHRQLCDENLSSNVSIAQVGTALAVDLTAEEELCSDSALQVAVNSKGKLCSASQRGSSGINPGILQVGF